MTYPTRKQVADVLDEFADFLGLKEQPMPAQAARPLRKVTLYLFEEDCSWAEHFLGRGWSETAREAFHDRIRAYRHRQHEEEYDG